MTDEAASRRDLRQKRQHKRRRVTVTGVLGELLITAGVIALLFVVWQMWLGDVIQGAQGKGEADALNDKWAAEAQKDSAKLPESDPSQKYNTLTAEPPKIKEPASGEDIATIIIPRLNVNFTVAEGTKTWESLDLRKIGHYDNTQMPGDKGNFAVAGHRGSYGAPFMDLPQMKVGDAVVVATKEGWYTYRYRNMEYVKPTEVGVLAATPQAPELGTTGRFMTMTTCSPRYGFSERLIGYSVFESFTPRVKDGKKPASLYLTKGS